MSSSEKEKFCFEWQRNWHDFQGGLSGGDTTAVERKQRPNVDVPTFEEVSAG